MKSKSGFWAAVIFLVSIPTALFVQGIFGRGAETVLHFAFAVGSVLLAKSAFDFRTPRLIRLAGALVCGSLALIFFLQGLGGITTIPRLNYVAFDVLGQIPERVLGSALLAWLAAILIYDSEGRTKLLGIVTLAVALGIEVYSYWLTYLGTSLDAEFAILKIVFLLPFVWLLVESGNRR